ncbi:MAG: polyprenyl synthetase family protein [Anaerolineae bacterium]
MSFKEVTKPMRVALHADMKEVLQANIHPPIDQLHGMMQYHMGWLNEKLQPDDAPAGKQIRPLLTMLCCQAAGGDWTQSIPAASAIELTHNFSLIHDDIEDNSATRRGRTTLWKIFGIPLGINAGDGMFAASRVALGRLEDRGVPAATIVKAFRRYDDTCLKLTQGQDADMSFETRQNVNVDEYVAMITGKTSVLLSLCAELGSIIAGKTATDQQHYQEYGLNLGLAFQILDDILGIWGDEETIGKSATTDISTRKKTLPILYGLENSPKLQKIFFDESIPEAEFVPEVVGLLNNCGAQEYATKRATSYSNLALSHLEGANPEGEAGKALYELTHLLLGRKS